MLFLVTYNDSALQKTKKMIYDRFPEQMEPLCSGCLATSNADDDSDTSPHDLEMGSDVEYNNINLSLAAHLTGGTHSFTHMQGDLDRQRLLGDRPRMVYESVLDEGLEGIEHQESSAAKCSRNGASHRPVLNPFMTTFPTIFGQQR
ncbi:hypothetical protein RP20_CCG014417 [Aedes albopictus]|nr:hypothetical protein RP20_CCG014417 [Aedes albopictus]